MAFPCSSCVGTSASTSATLIFRPESTRILPPTPALPPLLPLTTELVCSGSWLTEGDVVLAGPEAVGLDLGVGVLGGDVTGGVDDGLAGGLGVRVPGGVVVLVVPCWAGKTVLIRN